MSRREVGIASYLLHDIGDLVDGRAVRRGPRAPLRAVDRTEVAVRVGPLVPDPNAVIVEIFDVGIAGEEPEQFVDDRLEMQFLGREQRKTLGEIEPHLMAEHGQRPGAGTVVLLDAVSENPLHQVLVLAHGSRPPPTHATLAFLRRSVNSRLWNMGIVQCRENALGPIYMPPARVGRVIYPTRTTNAACAPPVRCSSHRSAVRT